FGGGILDQIQESNTTPPDPISLPQINVAYQIPQVSYDDTTTANDPLNLGIAQDASVGIAPPSLSYGSGMALFSGQTTYLGADVGAQQNDPNATQVVTGDGNPDTETFDDILNKYSDPNWTPIDTQPTVRVTVS